MNTLVLMMASAADAMPRQYRSGLVVCLLIATGTDGRRRAGVGGQNCNGVPLTARPLTGHAHPVRRQQAPPQATATDQCQGPPASCVADQTTPWDGTSAILTPRCGRIFASACGPTFATAIDEGSLGGTGLVCTASLSPTTSR
jgi:hypothetical protein